MLDWRSQRKREGGKTQGDKCWGQGGHGNKGPEMVRKSKSAEQKAQEEVALEALRS